MREPTVHVGNFSLLLKYFLSQGHLSYAMVVNGGRQKMGNIPEAEGERRREGYVIWEVDLIRGGVTLIEFISLPQQEEKRLNLWVQEEEVEDQEDSESTVWNNHCFYLKIIYLFSCLF